MGMVSSARSAAVKQVKVVIGRMSVVWSRAGIEPARPVGTEKGPRRGRWSVLLDDPLEIVQVARGAFDVFVE